MWEFSGVYISERPDGNGTPSKLLNRILIISCYSSRNPPMTPMVSFVKTKRGVTSKFSLPEAICALCTSLVSFDAHTHTLCPDLGRPSTCCYLWHRPSTQHDAWILYPDPIQKYSLGYFWNLQVEEDVYFGVRTLYFVVLVT